MHALNALWLLNEVNCNTEIEIKYVRSKSCDWFEIATKDFDFMVTEYGYCSLKYLDQPISHEKDAEYYGLVKQWVKKYYLEVL